MYCLQNLLSLEVVVVLLQLSRPSFAAPASELGPAIAAGINASPMDTADNPSEACATIVNSQDTVIFNASLAYECLTSVPFNAGVATSFLQYYNDTLQFQSTLAYLKNPPPSYQQPGVDMLEGLNVLQQAVNNGTFKNEYEFEASLQSLLYAAHDAHVNLFAGILQAFSFASPYDVVSVSLDGIQPPKVYLADDLFDSEYFTTFQPSAIQSINGVDVTTYLSEFAFKNSVGTLEPHADWNQLFLSPVLDILGFFDVFSGAATFYPGDEINIKFENNTNEINDRYIAIYNSQGPTGPLQTGGDFYNFFVLGFYPASFDPSDDDSDSDSSSNSTATSTAPSETATSSATPTPTVLSWNNSAFPAVPDVAQQDLGTYGGGFVSGYFLNSSSVSVLSIPSFDESGDEIATFQDAIGDFIQKSRDAGLKKVVIDVQQNIGGQVFLAYDAFKQFFPNIDPFDGSQMRAHPSGNFMGEAITAYWENLTLADQDYYTLAGNEWLATDRINADTGVNFTSWAEFFGPHEYAGDNFTTPSRYNLSSDIFTEAATHTDDFSVYGYGSNPAPPDAAPPYAPEDIVILSDGICDSSCALFLEMMHHEAGVRVVVVGGRPSPGPMQAPSGSRGARVYSLPTLDRNINYAQEILDATGSPDANFLPNRTDALQVYVTFGSINLRDQVRRNETTPLQFAYEAADCRIYYTPQTVYNMTNLWQYAADAMWSNSSTSKCVQGSTGFATTGTNKTDFIGPSSGTAPSSATGLNLSAHLNTSSIPYMLYLAGGLEDAGLKPRNALSTTIKSCTQDSNCLPGFACASVNTCLGSGKVGPQKQCVPTCLGDLSPCSNGGTCQAQSSTGKNVGNQPLLKGICPPANVLQKCGLKVTSGKINVGPPPPDKRR